MIRRWLALSLVGLWIAAPLSAFPPRGGGGGARPAPAPRPSFTPRPTPAPAPHPTPTPVSHPTPSVRPAPSIVNRPAQPAPRPLPANPVVRPTPTPLPTVPPTGRPHPGVVPTPTPLPFRPPNFPPINRPPERPGIGDRPPVADRPGVRPSGERPSVDLRPGGGRVVVNRPTTVAADLNRTVYRSGGWANGSYYGRYYRIHDGWYRGGWNYWRFRPGAWFVGGAAFSWLAAYAPTIVYANPYYDVPPPTVEVAPYLDYSQPITVAPQDAVQAPLDLPSDAPAVDPGEPAAEQQAQDLVDEARAAFKKGEYRRAQEFCDRALAQLPGDATIHEFRALTLFAQKKYREAAAAVYAVLAAGPGWNWETMRSFYPDAETYTTQLRTLETYVRDNPKSAAANFLLGYHYLTLGSPDAAARKFERAAELDPNDKVSPVIVKAIKQPEPAGDRPQPGQ